jgi:hypothetical protein
MDWIIQHLDQILTIVGMVMAWVIARPWAKAKLEQANALIDAKNMGVARDIALSVAQRVYQDTVRTLKDAGKFDAETKRLVFEQACTILKEELKAHGVELLSSLIPGIMQVAVMALKNTGQEK